MIGCLVVFSCLDELQCKRGHFEKKKKKVFVRVQVALQFECLVGQDDICGTSLHMSII